MSNETHGNLLHKKILTWIINKLCNKIFIYTCTCNTGILQRQKGEWIWNVCCLLIIITSAITSAGRLLEEMKSIHIWIITNICLIALSIFLLQVLVNTTSKPLWWLSLACGNLDWCMLTLCKRTVTHNLCQTSGNL